MYRFSKTIVLAIAVILLVSVGSVWSITKVPARMNIIDISGGYSMITGNYGGFRGDSWNEIFAMAGSNPLPAAISTNQPFISAFPTASFATTTCSIRSVFAMRR
jgi:hypothetical protein